MPQKENAPAVRVRQTESTKSQETRDLTSEQLHADCDNAHSWCIWRVDEVDTGGEGDHTRQKENAPAVRVR